MFFDRPFWTELSWEDVFLNTIIRCNLWLDWIGINRKKGFSSKIKKVADENNFPLHGTIHGSCNSIKWQGPTLRRSPQLGYIKYCFLTLVYNHKLRLFYFNPAREYGLNFKSLRNLYCVIAHVKDMLRQSNNDRWVSRCYNLKRDKVQTFKKIIINKKINTLATERNVSGVQAIFFS